MAAEARLWQKIRPWLVEEHFVQRIENLVGEGVPDLYVQRRNSGRACWIELKSKPDLPKRSTTRVFGDIGLRPEQVAWLYCRGAVGGRVWILAQAEDRMFLVHGMWAREFNDAPLAKLLQMSAWTHQGKLTGVHWKSLSQELTGC